MPRLIGVLALMLVLAGPAAAADMLVLDDGHVDLGPRLLDGRWTIELRDDTVDPPAWRSLDDVVMHAAEPSRVEVPDDPAYGFLGEPGAPAWLLPQVQKDGILWPGWNTQAPEVADGIRREMTWTLHGVQGPGKFVLFSSGEFGRPQILFDSDRSYPQQTGVEADTHVHGNWAFTAPGPYRLDVAMDAVTREGQAVSDRGVLRIFVGAGDPTAAFARATPAPAHVATETASAPLGWIAGAALVIVAAAGWGVRWQRSRSTR